MITAVPSVVGVTVSGCDTSRYQDGGNVAADSGTTIGFGVTAAASSAPSRAATSATPFTVEHDGVADGCWSCPSGTWTST